MATRAQSPPRPDMQAHLEAMRLTFPDLVSALSEHIGRKLIAYIASVKDVRTVDSWMRGKEPYNDAEQRLRLTFQVVKMLSLGDSKPVVQAWLTGVNPALGDRVPIRLLKEGELDKVGPEVIAAARAFLAGG